VLERNTVCDACPLRVKITTLQKEPKGRNKAFLQFIDERAIFGYFADTLRCYRSFGLFSLSSLYSGGLRDVEKVEQVENGDPPCRNQESGYNKFSK
jgi:hypothetical protein